jgi:hypothetical protein
MTYQLTMTITLSGDEYPVLEAAGMIDEVLEAMGKVDARASDGSPTRISAMIPAGRLAITTKSEERR